MPLHLKRLNSSQQVTLSILRNTIISDQSHEKTLGNSQPGNVAARLLFAKNISFYDVENGRGKEYDVQYLSIVLTSYNGRRVGNFVKHNVFFNML